MASTTLNHSITKDSEVLFITTRGWTQMWARLESNADGVNEIAAGSSFMEVDGGVAISQVLAPGTQVKIKTTSATQVKWSVMLTELVFLDVLVESLCVGGQ